MAEQSAIFQFASAQVCGCPKCWKTAERPIRCKDHSEKPFVVYESDKFSRGPRCTPDGRYLHAFNSRRDLLLVDLLRNESKLLTSAAPWAPDGWVEDFVVVDPFTLVVLIERDWDQLSLYLILLAADFEEYEPHLLHRFPDGIRTVGLRLNLGNGRVRHEILGRTNALFARGYTITFVWVDVAEAQLEVDHMSDFPFTTPRAFQWSNDGRAVCALEVDNPTKLHVYSLEQKKWTEEPLAQGGPAVHICWDILTCSSRTFYVRAPAGETIHDICPLFRFNMEQRKWEEVPASVGHRGHVHSIVNSTDGEEDGVVVTEAHEDRLKVRRFVFRRPESLKELALMAGKLREDVQVEEVFRLVTGKAPSTLLPSAYEGMQPITICLLE